MNNKREMLLTLPVRRPFKNVYQFKITLVETNPPVWRRIQVPESFSFYDLHVAIQDAMGWLDYHLHMFEIEGAGKGGKRVRIDCPFGDIEFEPEDYYLTFVFDSAENDSGARLLKMNGSEAIPDEYSAKPFKIKEKQLSAPRIKMLFF